MGMANPASDTAAGIAAPIAAKLAIVKALGSEGRYHGHTLLSSGRAVFLCLKLLREVLFYAAIGRRAAPASNIAVLVKGPNQERLFTRQRPDLEAEFGPLEVYGAAHTTCRSGYARLPAIRLGAAVRLLASILGVLVRRRARDLNLFYVLFFEAIERALAEGLPDIETLICFNDQPFDVAAIVHAVNLRDGPLTAVCQHGLILSEDFYFPAKAQQFRAWGPLSRRHFRGLDARAHMVMAGRYSDDRAQLVQGYGFSDAAQRPRRVLAAPSFHHDEILEIAEALKTITAAAGPDDQQDDRPDDWPEAWPEAWQVGIKLHPATKRVAAIWRELSQGFVHLTREADHMEELAARYDMLVTKNSTSALDFLLLGKPVVFLEFAQNGNFPSEDYGFAVSDAGAIAKETGAMQARAKNPARLSFLKDALHV